MADVSALAGILDRANKVFLLARTLGLDFQEDFQSRGPVHMVGDDPPRKLHHVKIEEFIASTLDMGDVVRQPPDGFATVADQLRVAGKLAKRLSNPNDNEILGLFPELNTLAHKGHEAVKEAQKTSHLDDPFAAFDEPKFSEAIAAAETATIIPTFNEILDKVRSTREQIRHPNPSHNPNRRASDAYNDYATISRMLGKCGIKAAPLPDQRFHPDQTLAYILRVLDDVELAVNRKGAKVEQSTLQYVADKPSNDASTFDSVTSQSFRLDPSETIAEVTEPANRPGDDSAGATEERKKAGPSTEGNKGPGKEQATYRLLSVFTGGLSDERFALATNILLDDCLNANEKLSKIGAIIPLPATASAEQLGQMLNVTKQAVLKTEWWIQNRKGEKANEIGRRHDLHKKRATQYESWGTSDEDDQ